MIKVYSERLKASIPQLSSARFMLHIYLSNKSNNTMKNYLITPIFIFTFLFTISFVYVANAQETTIEDIEAIVQECQNNLTSYSIEQSLEINNQLKKWEIAIGENEAILRVKILLSIHQANYSDDSSKSYIDNYITKYIDRYYASREPNYKQIYIQEKGYFDHVPLNGVFDAWTEALAVKLRSDQSEGTSEYIFCSLFANDIDRFYDIMYSKKI
jgi:hypothetical protein